MKILLQNKQNGQMDWGRGDAITPALNLLGGYKKLYIFHIVQNDHVISSYHRRTPHMQNIAVNK